MVGVVSRGVVPRPTFGPLAGRRSRALARRVAPVALAAQGWRLGEPLAGRGDTCVVAVRADDGTSPALLKVADTPQGRHQLLRQVEVLAALHADARLGPWARLVPRTRETGDVDGVFFVLEARLPGADPRAAPAHADRVVPLALAAVEELGRRTASVVRLDPATLDRWVHRPAAQVRAVVRGARRASVDRVEAELVAALSGRDAARSWVHGDYNRTNVLLHDGLVSGVVDWTAGEPDGLVGADAVVLLLWESVLAGRELGPTVLRRVAEPGPVREVVWGMQRRAGGPELSIRAMLLLSWLRHVGANLADSTRYAANPVWMHRNVRTVLAELDR